MGDAQSSVGATLSLYTLLLPLFPTDVYEPMSTYQCSLPRYLYYVNLPTPTYPYTYRVTRIDRKVGLTVNHFL